MAHKRTGFNHFRKVDNSHQELTVLIYISYILWTVEKMTNCGKNRFLQSLRYTYTVLPWIHILFFRMVFILSAILCWSDFTQNWVESFLKKHSILHLSAFMNSKHLKSETKILWTSNYIKLNLTNIPSEFRILFSSLCHSSLNLTWSRLLALFKKWKMFWYWPTISRPIPR